MILSNLQRQIPATQLGISGSVSQQLTASVTMWGHNLGLQPTRGTGPLTATPGGLSKVYGGQNPDSILEDNVYV